VIEEGDDTDNGSGDPHRGVVGDHQPKHAAPAVSPKLKVLIHVGIYGLWLTKSHRRQPCFLL
jgi:hypothetical protein